MIHSPKFTVVLDACVLYPAPVRDLLLSLANEGLFTPKWIKIIQDEWVKNLLIKRKDLNKKQLDQTIWAMNVAFPDSNVEHFEELIPGLMLPDKDDLHVLACAIRCNADLITTFNLKDFPDDYIKKYNIEIQSPDELISNLIDLNNDIACKAFRKMLKRLKNPPKSKAEVIETLSRCALKITSLKLDNQC